MGYTYNNVTIQECRTLSFEMVQERDPSNTDALWNKYTIRVRGFVSGSVGQFRNDSAVALNELKSALETPRRSFRYSIGNTVLVETGTGTASGLDAKNGPDPMPAIVREVTSGTFMVECGIVVRVVACSNTCEIRDPVVSLRWSQTETFDENWYSRLSTRGKLIVRSDLLQSADSFRPLATPPLLADYVRVSSHYNLSMDGLELDFAFEDQEKDRLPPFPATKASGSFTVVVEKGQKRVGQVDIHLEGPKGTSRADLMMLGVRMAYGRLSKESIQNISMPILRGSFKENLFDPVVDISIQGLLAPLNGIGFGAALGTAIGGAVAGVVGLKIPSDSNKLMAMPSVGTDVYGLLTQNRPGIAPPDRKRLQALLVAAFRDPCVCEGIITELRTTGRSSTFQRNLKSIPPTTNAALVTQGTPPPPSPVSTTTDPYPYVAYEMETMTIYTNGNVLMPATGVNGDIVGSVVETAGGNTVMLTTYSIGRIGLPPVLPILNTTDSNITPLKAGITTQRAVPSADGGGTVFWVAGYYIYAVADPRNYQLSSPVAPIDATLTINAAKESMGFWANLQNKVTGVANANPFVPGGAEPKDPESNANNFNPSPGQLVGLGGFTDLNPGLPGPVNPFLDAAVNFDPSNVGSNSPWTWGTVSPWAPLVGP